MLLFQSISKILVHLLLANCLGSNGEQTEFRRLSYSEAEEETWKMFLNAYDAVCWYEGGIRFPVVSTVYLYEFCFSKQKEFRDLLNRFPKRHQEQSEEFLEAIRKLGDQLNNEIGGYFYFFPEEYQDKCYLFDPVYASDKLIAEYSDYDYGNLLGNRFVRSTSLDNCLVRLLQDRAGKEILYDWKADRANKKKDWRKIMLDRTNALRDRHGSKPLEMSDTLNKVAQRQALEKIETWVKSCTRVKFPLEVSNSLGETYHGTTDIYEDNYDAAGLIAVNTCYFQIKDYKFPYGDGQQNENTDCFTALVWKSNEKVGYGLACSDKCNDYKDSNYCVVVIKYEPYGNVPNQFKDNVLNAKS